MMKGQLSLEFMLYVIFSVLAISGALLIYMHKAVHLDSTIQTSYLEGFVGVVNSNIGYSKSEFTAFVPKTICKSLINGSMLYFNKLVFSFNSNMKIDQSVCNDSGSVERLVLLNRYNGTYELGV